MLTSCDITVIPPCLLITYYYQTLEGSIYSSVLARECELDESRILFCLWLNFQGLEMSGTYKEANKYVWKKGGDERREAVSVEVLCCFGGKPGRRGLKSRS